MSSWSLKTSLITCVILFPVVTRKQILSKTLKIIVLKSSKEK